MTQSTYPGRLHHLVDSLSFLRSTIMDYIAIVKAYFAALDSPDMEQVDPYLSEFYQKVDFTTQPMDKNAMLGFIRILKAALPDLSHSLSNIRVEQNVVLLTVQLSGRNTGHLDLREMGIGVVPRTQKFIICPTANYEVHFREGQILTEKDVSPSSPNRRMSGILRAFGVSSVAI
jgi:predicted ester cyclase